MTDNWDSDDWENCEIPDLLVSINNKESELKLLEERKLVEEADLALAEDLFSQNKMKNESTDLALLKSIKNVKPIFKKNENQKDEELLKCQQVIKKQQTIKRHQELSEIQKNMSCKKREQKMNEKRHKELYGEAEADEIDEKYGYLGDEY